MLRRVLTQTLIAGVLASGALAGSAANPGPDGKTIAQAPTASAGATKAQTATPKVVKAQVKKAKTATKKAYQVGPASWYGRQFDGKTTASGETFDMYQLTAAHPSLPLGSWIKVTNLRNRKWVLVRVNDRGPYEEGRILDVSYSAARMLGFKDSGVAKVRIDLLDNGSGTDNTTLAMVGETPIQ